MNDEYQDVADKAYLSQYAESLERQVASATATALFLAILTVALIVALAVVVLR